jgi:nicotinamidase-related amidase
MLIDREDSLLLVVDIQDKLVPAVIEPEALIQGTGQLLEIAELLKVSYLISEQYPQGLGRTVAPLMAIANEHCYIDKQHFSCASDPACLERIRQCQRNQIIICGMEAHVCVLQTAIELKQQGFEVFVVSDLISSRSEDDRDAALRRFQQHQLQLVSKEMVIFEWLEKSGTDAFRTISKNYLR